MSPAGTLYLVPAPIAENGDLHSIPGQTLGIFQQVNYIITENRKSTIRYIKKAAPGVVLQELRFTELNEHTPADEIPALLEPLLAGQDAALLSEAGLPCVADPGAKLVMAAHQAGIRVVPLSGPSSLFMALMASGMNGQQFTFHGYLPVKPDERNKKIREIERDANRTGYTQLFIETPYRSDKMLGALLTQLQPETRLCVACEIASASEMIQTLPVKTWRKKENREIGKKNCVFLVG